MIEMPNKMGLITNMIRAVNITPRVWGISTQIAQKRGSRSVSG
jgi:hypothetical protein